MAGHTKCGVVKEFKPTGGTGTIRRELIERGGSHEVWYGAGEWDRTTDLRFTKPLLYQLSYAGRLCLARKQDG